MDYITILTFFNTCICLIFCGVIVSFVISKYREKQELNKLEGNWKGNKKQYIKDYKLHKQLIKEKMNEYLETYLKVCCFNCRTFDDKATDDYFCVVEGQCPGEDLTKSEKLCILEDKDNLLKKIKDITEKRGY